MKQRQIEFRREIPDLGPFGLREKLLHGEFSGCPAIERGLDAPRKRFETDHHVGPQQVQRRQRLQLPLVMAGVVVPLAEEHDLARRHLLQ